MTWLESVIEALESLGGKGYYSEIYLKVLDIRDVSKIKDYKAQIRGTIERHSSDSDVFKHEVGGEKDIFYIVGEKGDGYWGLRSHEK